LHVACIKMQGLSSEKDFYAKTLKQIKKVAGLAQGIRTDVKSFHDFAEMLEKCVNAAESSILIMLDEFDYVTSESFKSDLSKNDTSDTNEFIMKIRSLIQEVPNIKFILAGAEQLQTMVNDYHNPLFKAGRVVPISFLNPQDARDLIIMPLKSEIFYTEQAIHAIQKATSNHPYYIQLLCQNIIYVLNDKKITTVTRAEIEETIKYIERAEVGLFEYVWEITTKEAHLILSIIAKEMATKKWVPIERIEKLITECDIYFKNDIVSGSIEELLKKNFIMESKATLKYTISTGMLRSWINRHKPLKRVRRELTSC